MSIFFSNNTHRRIRIRIASKFGVSFMKRGDKYLGGPLFLGRAKTVEWNYLVDRLKMRLSNWKKKTLSHVGRSVFITTTLQALPQYIMQTYLLLATICNELNNV
uniref:Uncharacterized protein n=1 Tax=Nelumbo nucifera TaxID=4432 RepID=A0A822ZPL6_NELNU|nr:TPA_asm: hypothetical protein HUJ06_016700 [Nelumbo nucifera]